MIRLISFCLAVLVLSTPVLAADDAPPLEGDGQVSASSVRKENVFRIRRGKFLETGNVAGLQKLAEEIGVENPDARLRSLYEVLLGDIAGFNKQPPADILAHREKAVQIDPSYAVALALKGQSLFSLGKPEEALPYVQRALKFEPNNSTFNITAGNIYNKLNRFEESLVHYNRALVMLPDNGTLYLNKGVVLYSLNRWTEAIACYDEGARLDPQLMPAFYHNKGVALAAMGKHQDALAFYDQAFALGLQDPSAHGFRGVSLYELKRFPEALVELDAALVLPDNQGGIYQYQKALTLIQLSRFQEAVDCFDLILKASPTSNPAWYYKARTLIRLGRLEEAVKCYGHVGKGLLLAPACNENAALLLKLGRQEEALPWLDKAIQEDPQNAMFYAHKALTLAQLGRHEEALDYFDRALVLNPNEAKFYSAKGVSLHKLGRTKEAKTYIEKGAKLRPKDRPSQ